MKHYCRIDDIEYKKTNWNTVQQWEVHPFNYDSDYTDLYDTDAYRKTTYELNEIRWNLIKKYNPKTLLDYGCGNGSFLKHLPKDIKGYGYDLVDKDYDITKVPDPFDEYDIITFWDSLEHIEDLWFLEDLKTEYIAVSTPEAKFNVKGWDFENWKHRKVDEHIHYWDCYSLTNLMRDMGFRLEEWNKKEELIRQDIFSAVFKKG